jgi:hypothetical protein
MGIVLAASMATRTSQAAGRAARRNLLVYRSVLSSVPGDGACMQKCNIIGHIHGWNARHGAQTRWILGWRHNQLNAGLGCVVMQLRSIY